MRSIFTLKNGFSLLTLLLFSVVTMAQSKVTGTVTAAIDGLGMPGVVVSIKNSNQAASTDVDGKYTLNNVPAKATLVFHFLGYKTKEVTYTGQTTINVALESDAKDLGEVVITAMGIKREQKALGYAASTIKSDQITRAGSPNFAGALYGKAPGVRIATTPGGATSASNITIRGVNTITGKNQPLIIMDGVPIRDGEVNNGNYWDDQRLRGNGLLDINPEDIDNISILKGASAAALYGSEAVNGVVLITTKSGKGKKGMSVDFSANYSSDNVAFLPRYQNVRGPGAPLNVSNGGQDETGFIYQDLDGNGTKETRGVLGYSINFGPKFDGKPTVAWDGQIRPYEAQIDNYKGLFRSANNSNVNVAISQAFDNASLRFSLTRQDNQGVSLGANNVKNIANLNSSFKLSKNFTTDVLVNYINQNTHNRPYSIDRMINNFTGMMGRFDNAAWYLNKYKTSQGYRFVTGSNQSTTPSENIKYPGFKADIGDYVWRVNEHNSDELSNRVIASMTNNWQIINDLKLRARISTDFTSQKTENKQATEQPLSFGNSGGFGLNTFENSIIYGDVLLTYAKKLTSNLEVSVMGGYTASKERGTTTGISTNGGLSVENWFDIAASVNPINGATTIRNAIVKDAYIGTVNANYKGYLFVEGTVRNDRTSTMHPDHNSFFYPSLNSSFVFTEAFQLPNFINYGKVRASWGIVGNYADMYSANIAYQQNNLGVQQTGGNSVLYTNLPVNFGNDKIKPEEKHEYELGLETKFLQNRLGFEISYYNAQIRDQILPLTLPATSGATSVLTNIGTLRNKGVEVAITGTPIKTSSFKWDAAINFSQNKNKVEKLANGSSELLHADFDGNAAQLKSVVGQPMGDFYAHPIATDSKGNKIVDGDGLYKLDADKMVKVGNAMPKVIGGLSNSFSYKGFTLDAMLDFRFGGYVMPTGINWMVSRGLLEESLKYMDKEHGGLSYYVNSEGKGVQTNAAQGPNGEKVYNDGMLMDGVTADGQKNTNVMSQAYYYWNTYNWGGPQYSASRYELYIQKNSYVKFREVSLGYNIPSKIAGRIGAKNLTASVFGRNLFYLYRTLKDMDAEQTTAGSRWSQTLTNAGTNPSTRTFGIMLRASF
ncbi:SusC/RagA family TonB-linked outer membrane protein [Solitalea lacus]|uniref:SusC/RagA family TonB-linked outer membrane protein n=1 Tax=Solitalea lacus TaxID=2911172 RepID=UPI001EDAEA2F|nr:SusC/RagA family TonB-linked outer membrane protein [Solitalea lacus]UKJ05877.1 SusC/RagA family TonB-linked outer membrane protein [Solitalea lacus]